MITFNKGNRGVLGQTNEHQVAQHLNIHIVFQSIIQVLDESRELFPIINKFYKKLQKEGNITVKQDTNAIKARIEESVHALIRCLSNLESIIHLVLEWAQVDLSD